MHPSPQAEPASECEERRAQNIEVNNAALKALGLGPNHDDGPKVEKKLKKSDGVSKALRAGSSRLCAILAPARVPQ